MSMQLKSCHRIKHAVSYILFESHKFSIGNRIDGISISIRPFPFWYSLDIMFRYKYISFYKGDKFYKAGIIHNFDKMSGMSYCFKHGYSADGICKECRI